MKPNKDENIETWAKLMSDDLKHKQLLKDMEHANAFQKQTQLLSGNNSISINLKDIETTNSWSKLAKSLSASNTLSKHFKSIQANRSWIKLAESLTTNSTFSDHLKNIEFNNSLTKLAKSLTASNIISAQLKNINGNDSWAKLTKSLSASSVFSEHLKNNEVNNSWTKLAESLTASNTLSEHLKNIEANSSLANLTRTLTASGVLSEHLKTIPSNSTWGTLATSLTAYKSFSKYLNEFNETSSFRKWAESVATSSAFTESFGRLKDEHYLDSLFENFEKENSDTSSSVEAELAGIKDHDVDETLRQLASADTPSGFAQILEKTPKALKWLLFTFLLTLVWQLALGAASGVIGNLVTPYVQAYLEEFKSTPQREQIKVIKKLSFSELGVELSGYRFVTTNSLSLRATPNARAPVIGELKFGQVIKVLSTSRDWTQVVYEYGDGTTITGWTFTRYVAKFRG